MRFNINNNISILTEYSLTVIRLIISAESGVGNGVGAKMVEKNAKESINSKKWIKK